VLYIPNKQMIDCRTPSNQKLSPLMSLSSCKLEIGQVLDIFSILYSFTFKFITCVQLHVGVCLKFKNRQMQTSVIYDKPWKNLSHIWQAMEKPQSYMTSHGKTSVIYDKPWKNLSVIYDKPWKNKIKIPF